MAELLELRTELPFRQEQLLVLEPKPPQLLAEILRARLRARLDEDLRTKRVVQPDALGAPFDARHHRFLDGDPPRGLHCMSSTSTITPFASSRIGTIEILHSIVLPSRLVHSFLSSAGSWVARQ